MLITECFSPAEFIVEVSVVDDCLCRRFFAFFRFFCILSFIRLLLHESCWSYGELHVELVSELIRVHLDRAGGVIDPLNDEIGELGADIVLDIFVAHPVNSIYIE